MNQAISMQFRVSPQPLGQYLRALLARGNGRGEATFPSLEAILVGIRADRSKVTRYAAVCGFAAATDHLPLTYPHILAFPLHMELMLHKDFPLPLMGLVHISNRITQQRHIRLDEKLDIRCRLGQQHHTDKGIEFDILTEISVAGEMVWQSVSTNLFRKASGTRKGPRTAVQAEPFTSSEFWQLPSSLGRQYARVSGDSNPIHLHPLAARLFGFKRHIAHGMWSKARIAAALESKFPDGRCELSTEFKLPVFLPANVEFCSRQEEQKTAAFRFELRSPGGEKVHVKGIMNALN